MQKWRCIKYISDNRKEDALPHQNTDMEQEMKIQTKPKLKRSNAICLKSTTVG